MKKLIFLLILCLSVFAFTACGDDEYYEDDDDYTSEEQDDKSRNDDRDSRDSKSDAGIYISYGINYGEMRSFQPVDGYLYINDDLYERR